MSWFKKAPALTPDQTLARAVELAEVEGVLPDAICKFIDSNQVPGEQAVAFALSQGLDPRVLGLDWDPEPEPEPDGPTAFLCPEGWTARDVADNFELVRRTLAEAGLHPGLTVYLPSGRWAVAAQSTVTAELSPAVKLTDGERVAAQRPGEELLVFKPYERKAVFGGLSSVERQARQVLASALHCYPWQLDVQVALAPEGSDHAVEWVMVSGQPLLDTERAKLQKTLEDSMLHLPGGSEGWKLDWTEGLGTALLTYGEKAKLPDFVPAVMSQLLDPSNQWVLPYGADAWNQQVAWNVTAEPHGMGCGRTGCGKSILLASIISAALSKGWDVALCEVSKGLADFDEFRDYVMPGGWGSNLHDASQVITNLYALKDTRMAAIKAAGHKKLHSMTRAEQEAAGLKPILLVIDEAASLLAMPPSIKGLDKDDPIAVRVAEEQRDVALMGDAIRRISAECRAVGLHLFFSTQRFDAKLFTPAGGGLLRAQLGHRIVLGSMSSTTLSMSVESVDGAAAAYAIAHGSKLTNDPSADAAKPVPGRGIVEMSTITVPVQVVYAPIEDWIQALEDRNVRKPGGSAPVTATSVTEPAVKSVQVENPFASTTVVDDVFDPDLFA